MSNLSHAFARVTLRALVDGTLASVLSGGTAAARSRAETGSAVAPINAPSHWYLGESSIHSREASFKRTTLGALTHHASSVFWALLYEGLRSRRRRPTMANAVVDAAAVTALAAVVDLKVVPKRLTPGFERQLSGPSLFWVYASFGVGLALGGMLDQQRR